MLKWLYYVVDAENADQRISGWVPVAPIGTSAYSESEYESLKVIKRPEKAVISTE